MQTKAIILGLAVLTGVSACSWLNTPFKAQQIREAQSAHKRCESKGLHYPSRAYTECRLEIAETRQQRQYQALNMSHQSGAGSEPPHDMGIYKPVDAASFGCHRTKEDDGTTWIKCGEGE